MEYVSVYMRFIDFKDFYDRCEIIKDYFDDLSLKDKYTYKMYIYSNRLIKEYKLDKIWEFLNEPFGSAYYVSSDMLGAWL